MKKRQLVILAFPISLLIIAMGYMILDQSVTLTYQRDSYSKTEEDLEKLILIINQTDYTKNQISEAFKRLNPNDSIYFKTDTVSLNRISLIFDKNKLKSVKKDF